ncbi:MAG: phosphoribosylanthranilate isomerase [Actinomycetia bacterium]|jgi:phosphoribosylanthranilate isomerase|nr:phosphoribosylanthranilate isomerase [Actinomycetes bacterium]
MWVKVCGITNEEDALLAVSQGADALGFVFASGSSRQVTAAAVAEIIHRLPRETITVGVFRNERPERVVELVHEIGLKGAQLHGREPLSEVRWVRKRVPFVIQAFNAGDAAIPSAANGPADIVLIDSPGGGSGKVFDWSLAEGAPGGVRLLLAGGLNPENVAEAIQRVRPWGVDVSTGVEASRGKKDPKKVQRFIDAAKEIGEDILVEDRPAPTNGSRPFDWDED